MRARPSLSEEHPVLAQVEPNHRAGRQTELVADLDGHGDLALGGDRALHTVNVKSFTLYVNMRQRSAGGSHGGRRRPRLPSLASATAGSACSTLRSPRL